MESDDQNGILCLICETIVPSEKLLEHIDDHLDYKRHMCHVCEYKTSFMHKILRHGDKQRHPTKIFGSQREYMNRISEIIYKDCLDAKVRGLANVLRSLVVRDSKNEREITNAATENPSDQNSRFDGSSTGAEISSSNEVNIEVQEENEHLNDSSTLEGQTDKTNKKSHKKRECKVCNKRIRTSRKSLQLHAVTHLSDVHWVCSKCDFSAENFDGLENHVVENHPTVEIKLECYVSADKMGRLLYDCFEKDVKSDLKPNLHVETQTEDNLSTECSDGESTSNNRSNVAPEMLKRSKNKRKTTGVKVSNEQKNEGQRSPKRKYRSEHRKASASSSTVDNEYTTDHQEFSTENGPTTMIPSGTADPEPSCEQSNLEHLLNINVQRSHFEDLSINRPPSHKIHCSECGEGVESIFMAQRLHVVSKHLLLDPTLPVDANDENFRECMDSCFPGAIPRDDLDCRKCGKAFTSESGRQGHVARTHLQASIECPFNGCPILSAYTDEVCRHVKVFHNCSITRLPAEEAFRWKRLRRHFLGKLIPHVSKCFPNPLPKENFRLSPSDIIATSSSTVKDPAVPSSPSVGQNPSFHELLDNVEQQLADHIKETLQSPPKRGRSFDGGSPKKSARDFGEKPRSTSVGDRSESSSDSDRVENCERNYENLASTDPSLEQPPATERNLGNFDLRPDKKSQQNATFVTKTLFNSPSDDDNSAEFQVTAHKYHPKMVQLCKNTAVKNITTAIVKSEVIEETVDENVTDRQGIESSEQPASAVVLGGTNLPNHDLTVPPPNLPRKPLFRPEFNQLSPSGPYQTQPRKTLYEGPPPPPLYFGRLPTPSTYWRSPRNPRAMTSNSVPPRQMSHHSHLYQAHHFKRSLRGESMRFSPNNSYRMPRPTSAVDDVGRPTNNIWKNFQTSRDSAMDRTRQFRQKPNLGRGASPSHSDGNRRTFPQKPRSGTPSNMNGRISRQNCKQSNRSREKTGTKTNKKELDGFVSPLTRSGTDCGSRRGNVKRKRFEEQRSDRRKNQGKRMHSD